MATAWERELSTVKPKASRRRLKNVLLDCLLECKYEKQMFAELPLAPPKGFRKAIPDLVKLKVVLRQDSLCATCGERLGKLDDTQFDHVPAVQLRCWDPEAKDTIPPSNDVESHLRKTHRLPRCQDLRVEGIEARRRRDRDRQNQADRQGHRGFPSTHAGEGRSRRLSRLRSARRSNGRRGRFQKGARMERRTFER